MFINRKSKFEFKGDGFVTCTNWFNSIPLDFFKNKPINYLEIGVFYGNNLFTVAETYANHPESKLYGIDPWEDYDEYPEYKNEQNKIFTGFQENLKNFKLTNNETDNKFQIYKEYSHNIVHTFENNSFDLIYIDGNHEPEYVLEDAVLVFRKLKVNGYIIFDDYGWGGDDMTQKGIDAFMKAYSNRIKKISLLHSQMIIQKIK